MCYVSRVNVKWCMMNENKVVNLPSRGTLGSANLALFHNIPVSVVTVWPRRCATFRRFWTLCSGMNILWLCLVTATLWRRCRRVVRRYVSLPVWRFATSSGPERRSVYAYCAWLVYVKGQRYMSKFSGTFRPAVALTYFQRYKRSDGRFCACAINVKSSMCSETTKHLWHKYHGLFVRM